MDGNAPDRRAWNDCQPELAAGADFDKRSSSGTMAARDAGTARPGILSNGGPWFENVPERARFRCGRTEGPRSSGTLRISGLRGIEGREESVVLGEVWTTSRSSAMIKPVCQP